MMSIEDLFIVDRDLQKLGMSVCLFASSGTPSNRVPLKKYPMKSAKNFPKEKSAQNSWTDLRALEKTCTSHYVANSSNCTLANPLSGPCRKMGSSFSCLLGSKAGVSNDVIADVSTHKVVEVILLTAVNGNP